MTHLTGNRAAPRVSILIAVLVLGLVAAACTGSTATPSPAAGASGGSGASAAAGGGINGTWVLTKYTSPDGTEFTVPGAVTPTLTLDGNAATANTGCNTVNALADVTATTIIFSQVQSSKAACPEPMGTVENAYLQALNLQSSYTVTGDTLVMQGRGGNPSLTFIRQK